MRHHFQLSYASRPRRRPASGPEEAAPTEAPRAERPVRPRILVADDARVMRLKLTRVLEQAGFEVEQAADGPEVLDRAQMARPDLILMDLDLREMDGWTVLRQLASIKLFRHIPVVVFSHGLSEADRNYARTCGAHSVLERPLPDAALVAHVQAVLTETEQHRPVRKRPADCVVLVADASGLMRRKVLVILGQLGCTLVEAEDLEQALLLARKHHPDLILLDDGLPGIESLSAARLRLAGAVAHEVPVVVMSANSQRDDVIRAMQAGVQDYVVKPFSGEHLTERVRCHLPL